MKLTKKSLRELLANTDNKLEKDIIRDLISEDEPENYIKDVLSHGCSSGVVCKLIYYTDTKKYFSKFMEEIEELKDEMEESTGEPLNIGTPMSNWLAWFGYEETIRKIADKLSIEY